MNFCVFIRKNNEKLTKFFYCDSYTEFGKGMFKI